METSSKVLELLSVDNDWSLPTRHNFESQKSDGGSTETAEYPAPWRLRSSRSILWNDRFYNFEASTMAEFHLESLLLQGSGHMSKAQRCPNTEPHAPPEALDSRSIFWKGRPIFYNVQVSTMTDTHQRRYVFQVQRTHDWKTWAAEYPIPWHPRSFKSILWNGPAFFYNFEA